MPATRSHFLGSCHTCRRRHVRCDRRRPLCSKCRSLGVPCEGFSNDVRWVFCNDQNSIASDGQYQGMRRYLYSEKSRLSMSATLGNGLISGSVEATLAEIDRLSQGPDQSDTGDVVIGPFRVLSSNPALSGQETALVEPENDSTPAPALPTVTSAEAAGSTVSHAAANTMLTDQFGYMDDFLHWSDILGLELDSTEFPTWPTSTALDDLDSILHGCDLPPTEDGGEASNAASIPWSHQPTLNGLSHLMWAPTSLLSSEIPSQPEIDVLADAPFLLNHLQANVAPLMVAMPLGRKSPWTMLNIPAAVITLGDLTFMSAGHISHARLANLYSLLACSAVHLTLQLSKDTDFPVQHWQRVTTQAFAQAKEQIQLTLKNELGLPKKAKYRPTDGALSPSHPSTHTYLQIISGQTRYARCLLLDCERLVRLRGLVKRKISQKARLLHHVYTWHRIVGESTYVLHDYTPSKTFLHALQNNFQSTPPADGPIGQPDELSPRLDNFLRLETKPSDYDLNIDERKDQETSLQDIHLQDSRNYPETLYKQIYGIPETWLSLLSQTTRLANVMETLWYARQSVPYLPFDAYETLHRRSVRLECMICSLASRQAAPGTDITNTDNELNPAEHILRALNAALLIFFYRRVRKVHPLLLQHHVDAVISGLEAFRISTPVSPPSLQNTNKTQDQPINLGSAWPAFIAGCEAIGAARRKAMVSWLDWAYASCRLTPIATAKEIMQRLWTRQDACLATRGEMVKSWIDLVREEEIWPLLC
ncbi:hypothetical protein BDW72DRAFT_213992 [Aspergillus terricola var. indicus]